MRQVETTSYSVTATCLECRELATFQCRCTREESDCTRYSQARATEAAGQLRALLRAQHYEPLRTWAAAWAKAEGVPAPALEVTGEATRPEVER